MEGLKCLGSIRRQIRNASSSQNLPRSQVAVSVIVLVWHHYVSSSTLHLASVQLYICTILTCHLTASANVIRPDYSRHNEFRSMIHATGIMHRGALHRTHRALTLYTGGHTTHRGIMHTEGQYIFLSTGISV